MAKPKKNEEVGEAPKGNGIPPTLEVSQKEKLLVLHKTLMDLNIRSIGDLENLIARA